MRWRTEKVMIDLWLDDLRPAPAGWMHVKTFEEAQEYLYSRKFDRKRGQKNG
jgi:hypothetical protein